MRIAITTWHTGVNPGTFFQCYGLYDYLRQRGHEVRIIDYRHQPQDLLFKGVRYYLTQLVPLVKRKIARHHASNEEKQDTLPYLREIEERELRCASMWKWMTYTPPVETQADFEALNSQFDAFVVGSDQVWNATMLNRRYLLDYVSAGKLKVAYGPSVGVGQVLPYQRQMYRCYVRSFDAVAVREKLLCDILNEELPELHARHLLDPSMLIDRGKYVAMAELPRELEGERYLLCYFAPNEPREEAMIRRYATERGLKLVVMAMFGYSWKIKADHTYCASPAQFIGLILHAEAVFTSSFHCTIFSILFHRDLFVLERERKYKSGDINQRYMEQLVTYQMEHRFIPYGSELTEEILRPIDHERVELIFQQRLKDSKAFLNNLF